MRAREPFIESDSIMAIRRTHPVRSLSLAAIAGTALALAVPAAAHAHVGASASSTAAGSYTVITFSVPHGCEGSPTQVVTIDIPESVPSVTPTVNPSWSVEKVSEPTADGEGDRVAQVVYTSLTGGLPSDLRDTFELSLLLPEGEEGDVVEFPVTQTCTEGSVTWEGEDVPAIMLTAATGDAHGHGLSDEHTQDSTGSTSNTDGAAGAASGDGDLVARILGIVGVAVGIVGVAIALVSRRATRATN